MGFPLGYLYILIDEESARIAVQYTSSSIHWYMHIESQLSRLDASHLAELCPKRLALRNYVRFQSERTMHENSKKPAEKRGFAIGCIYCFESQN